MKRFSNVASSPAIARSVPIGGLVSSAPVSTVPSQYPHRLSLYLDPPVHEVTIEEFEEMAMDRLEVLRAIDAALMKGMRDDELAAVIRAACTKHRLGLHNNEVCNREMVQTIFNERQRDNASHFILRLAFCGSAEGQRWFLQTELALFRHRWSETPLAERAAFESIVTQGLPVLGEKEKTQLLLWLSYFHPQAEDWYLVPWQDVLDLVGRRAVFLAGGIAHVPKSESISIVCSRLRAHLEEQLEMTAKELPLLKDDRLMPLLDLIKRSDAAAPVGDASRGFVPGSNLTAADIEAASAHFPLCATEQYRALRRDAHLKYNGRQQFGLFLKSIGLPLEEAMAFWRRSFAAKTTDEAFAKNYAYNIRHNYGQEGKRANYAPFPCSKIISGQAPAAGDHHGCPFKHAAGRDLEQMLREFNQPKGIPLNNGQIEEIMSLVREHHYQVACTRLFEYSRGLPPQSQETVTWPSKYFEASISSLKTAQ